MTKVKKKEGRKGRREEKDKGKDTGDLREKNSR